MGKEVRIVDGCNYDEILKSVNRVMKDMDDMIMKLRIERAALVAQKTALDAMKELIDTLKIEEE